MKMKKLVAGCWLLVAGALAAHAEEKEPVPYLDWDAEEQALVERKATGYTVYNGEAWLDAGKTYVVTGAVTVANPIEVNGTVANPTRLILCDGATLAAQWGVMVEVRDPTTNALIICGQSVGSESGKLVARGSDDGGAGIGGGYGGAGGTVTINGGMVTATGGDGGAGIGGGYGGAGGTVTVNGGTVTANGCNGGAGIGGGNGKANSGVVTFAPGNWWILAGAYEQDATEVSVDDYQKGHSAAYVRAERVQQEPVPYLDWDAEEQALVERKATGYTVYNGEAWLDEGTTYVVTGAVTVADSITVNGTVANPTRLILCDGATLTANQGVNVRAIGSTTNALIICGQSVGSESGKLVATGFGGAGIGGGGAGGTVTINGGTVTANGGRDGAGIGGGGGGGAGGTVTINGGTVTANGGDGGAGIGGGDGGAGGTVTINGGTVTATGGEFGGAGIGGGMVGAGGTVTINGGTVTANGGRDGAGIGGGGGGMAGSGVVKFGAGGWRILAGADEQKAKLVSVDEYQKGHGAAYVRAERVLQLKIPVAGANYSYVVSNETSELTGVLADGMNTYTVVKDATVKVYFTLDEGCVWAKAFANPMTFEKMAVDTVVDASAMPTAGSPGSEEVPWPTGDTVTAWTNGVGGLIIEGTGAMSNFVDAASVPWAAVAGEITAVSVAEGVTLGKNALAVFADTVTVNGLTISFQKMTAESAGASEPPIPEGMVLVTKESIQAAKAMTVQIVNGQIELSVSVLSNADITAEAPWAPVKFTPDTKIGLSSDGTKLVLPIPVAAQQGFMILQSGDAKVSEGGRGPVIGEPWYKPTVED